MKRIVSVIAVIALCLTQAASLSSCATPGDIAGGVFLGLLLASGNSEDLIETSVSPNNDYTLEAYCENGGATTGFAVRVYLITDGGKKEIYFQYHKADAVINWESDSVVNINGVILDLSMGETYSSYDRVY